MVRFISIESYTIVRISYLIWTQNERTNSLEIIELDRFEVEAELMWDDVANKSYIRFSIQTVWIIIVLFDWPTLLFAYLLLDLLTDNILVRMDRVIKLSRLKWKVKE